MAIKFDTTTRNAMLDALIARLGTSARLRVYNGTRPADPGTAITTQTMLVELTCNATAFAPAASGGVLTANAISNGTAAANGTVKFFNDMKGFGFVQRDDGGEDVFVHISALERSGMGQVTQGDRLAFDIEIDRRGKYSATNLGPLSE